MYFVAPLVVIIAFIKVSLACPFPDLELCGSDGKTYKNICEWKIAKLADQELTVVDLGPCDKNSLQYLYRLLLARYGNNDNLPIKSSNPNRLIDRRSDVRSNKDDKPQKDQRMEPLSVYFLRSEDDGWKDQ